MAAAVSTQVEVRVDVRTGQSCTNSDSDELTQVPIVIRECRDSKIGPPPAARHWRKVQAGPQRAYVYFLPSLSLLLYPRGVWPSVVSAARVAAHDDSISSLSSLSSANMFSRGAAGYEGTSRLRVAGSE